MTGEPPPELAGYHTRNMRHALAVFLVPAAAGCWAWYRGTDDALQAVLAGVFIAGVVAFMATVLFKAVLARPKCPDCARKMTQLEHVTIDRSQWRIVGCTECGKKFRIPGLSSE